MTLSAEEGSCAVDAARSEGPSSGDSCSTFCPVDSTAFAITDSWAIDTAKRSYSIAANFWACLQPTQALPNPSHARTIVIDTRSSPVTLCGNARFVIMAG